MVVLVMWSLTLANSKKFLSSNKCLFPLLIAFAQPGSISCIQILKLNCTTRIYEKAHINQDSDSGTYHSHDIFHLQLLSVKKIIKINPYMLGTTAGGAADCQFWHRNLGIKYCYTNWQTRDGSQSLVLQSYY
ncbi:unnamed protein product [Musa textilis]